MEATAESRAPSLTAEIDDFRNKIGTDLPQSALQRYGPESMGQQTFGWRASEDRF